MGMRKKHIVTLTESEREQLKNLIAVGKGSARLLAHARILLKADHGADKPACSDAAIAEAIEVSVPTVQRVRQRFVEEGLDAALVRRRPRREYRHKLDGHQEAQLVALTCSTPPEGQARWTLRLLADKMVELEYVEELSYQTVRRVLKKTSLSPGARSSG